jgi:hypothetical protein
VSWADYISAIANLVMAFAAIGGALTAVVGLNSWKKQRTFERDSELARKILVVLYRYTTALHVARTGVEQGNLRRQSSYQYLQESKVNPDLLDEDSDAYEKWSYEREVEIHEHFYSEIESCLTELRTLTFEAEAIWPDGFANLYFFLSRFEIEWKQAVGFYLSYLSPDTPNKEAAYLSYDPVRHICVRERWEADEFDNRLKEVTKTAEAYLRKKLRGETP